MQIEFKELNYGVFFILIFFTTLYVIQLSDRVYNPYMKYDVTHILTSLKNDVKGTETDN
jgi:hypothetical protein